MTLSGKYRMKVDDFDTDFVSAFKELRKSEDLFDVTLVSDDEVPIQAHKVVLSASSSFFRKVLKFNKSNLPLLYIRGLTSKDLDNIVDFLYNGETTVEESDLQKFLKVARDLKLTGLFEDNSVHELSLESKENKTIKNEKQKHPKKNVILEKQDKSEKIDEQETGQPVPYLTNITDGQVKDEPVNEDIAAFDEKILEIMKREDKLWHCKMCGLTNSKKSNMQDHIGRTHLDWPQQRCSFCDLVAKNLPSLAKHVRKKHSSIC